MEHISKLSLVYASRAEYALTESWSGVLPEAVRVKEERDNVNEELSGGLARAKGARILYSAISVVYYKYRQYSLSRQQGYRRA